ncbi:hypothetical protein C2S52_016593 [Perilla frutescens var. hirtella]|nr:hypothetical protein C2S52_016593 [Perilla frutescens var. hirtella]
MNPEIPSRRSLWFIFITILIFPIAIRAQQSSNRNITPGSSFVANADASTLTLTWTTSPSGEFAFGFKQVAPGGFLLSIWLDQVPEKTVVWSANRNNPVPSRSRVQLNAAGKLELIDQTGRSIWAANDLQGRSGRVAYAAMLDIGNLVLATNTSAILWQSFDAPTDTLLPGQVLERRGVLVSSFSETNYSKGRFKLTFQGDGDLVLYTRMFPLDDNNAAYWRSETRDTGFRLIFNQSGSIYLTRSNGTLLKPLFDNGAPAGGRFHQQRLTLDYDGVLRHYVYPKSVHAFVPSNICLEIGEEHTGGGACGYNSICSVLGSDGRPSCDCPPRYTSRGGLSGCAPDFLQHQCDQQSQDAQHFTFIVMFNRDWPVVDYANFKNVDEEWCKQSCLNDCYCAVAIYFNRGCHKKSLPFSNGRADSGFEGKSFIKVRKKDSTSSNTSAITNSSKRSSTALIITLSVLLGCSVLFFLLSSLFFLFYFNPRKLKMLRASKVHSVGVNTITRFSFKELQEATNGFEDELGRGACSTVYQGAVKDTGKVVAVKKLNRIAKESDPEFQAEVRSISRTNHKNLVQLLGYCDEGQHRILVYEFMTNGSLANFLFQNSPGPNWYIRVQIAFAIARGLCYLHEECSTPIIHCDIKPQNVLLDESYTPKIADFGLAKLMRPDQTMTITGIRGTRGYVAPEWFRNMPITVKVDVYSFGILLLELLCCRKNYEVNVEDEREVVLADWVYDCYQDGALDLLVAGDEEAKSDMKMLERLVWIAIWCVQEDPTVRPQMKRVMHMLDGSIQVPAPPDPTTFIT